MKGSWTRVPELLSIFLDTRARLEVIRGSHPSYAEMRTAIIYIYIHITSMNQTGSVYRSYFQL
jgi:hypothetical protein